MTRDAVSAKQERCSWIDHYGFQIDLNRRFGSKRSTDNVAARMIRSLLLGHAAGPHFLGNNRVIHCFLDNVAVRLKAVKPRITDMSNGRHIPTKVESNDGRCHLCKL